MMMTDHFDAGQAIGGPVVFERLRAEAFRGFATQVDIDLNASVVIVHGPNGLGKTSLFDAIQWVLLGDLARLREARMRQTDEYIVNAYRPGRQATVEVEMRLAGQHIRLSRTGDRSGSVLTWISVENGTLRGQEAEALLASMFGGGPDLDLAASLNACGLLQQDTARDILLSKPRDRFDTFSKILGLGELSDIQQWAHSASDKASADFKQADEQVATVDRQVAEANSQLAALQRNAANRPVIADVAERLSELIAAEGFILPGAIDSRDRAAAIAAFATTTAREAASSAEQTRRLMAEAGLLSAFSGTDLDDLQRSRVESEAALTAARQTHQAARSELDRLQAAQASLAAMAGAVLTHVVGPSCPACGQLVDAEELRNRLQQLEGALSTTEAQARLTAASAAVLTAQSRLALALQTEEDEVDRNARRVQWRLNQQRLQGQIGSLSASSDVLRLPPIGGVDSATIAADLDSLADSSARIAATSRELVSAWDASSSSDETRAANFAEQMAARLEAAHARRDGLARAKTNSASLHDAIRQSRLEVVRREFARLSPLAQDIYSRLDAHPTFQDIDLVSDLFRSAGTTVAQVRDSVFEVAADPMVIFSSAQANIAAISYLMALNLASSVGAPVLLLDDPLQAMDDVNVLGFADLCRHVRRERQLFISTHERRFALLLERKLAPRQEADRTIAVEFVGWDRAGPTLKPRDVPDQLASLASAFASA